MTAWLLDLPRWVAFAAIAGTGVLRGIGYYLFGFHGRPMVADRGEGSPLARRLSSPAVARAESAVRRLGAPAVTVAYVVYGLSAATIITAGMTRMRFLPFLTALTTGALAWAALLTAVGTAVVSSWGSATLPWAVVALAAGVLTYWVSRRLRHTVVVDLP